MKEQAKEKVKELVERFRYNLDVYKKSAYNETQVRQEFINPFFEALGWDVSNKQGDAEQYKDVVHEDAIKVGGSTRAPDYSFRIGGQRKFFVEAKKPSVNIKEDISPAYQLRRYAWSAKLPLSIVTDFEELSVYDCRIKPGPKDKASMGRIGYYTFEEYLDKFDEIYDVFSMGAIRKGSFDRHAQSTKGKRGTAEVDSEFLKEIESWREMLAKNIALRNPDVSIYELNYAVQKIIDRIIFLRICEDRGIEPDGHLQLAVKSTDVYKHLLNQFRSAESNYNSGIFDFKADAVTPRLEIDDKVLKAIIDSLYYPKSPYEFSVLGVEILGNVYEQFLGKVIRLTAGHQAKVETKPEVKKAGGVYYTPQYIVDYIVKNTVGKLVAGKTPEEIAEIKILDPACGSGSFLIGAYTYLLRYHLDWYVENKPKKHKKAVFQVRENEWYLTTDEKKRILLSNIFGVDIDSQAVEVTKLSLQLKVLENESREGVDQQVKLGMEGILPNLGGNIKCGNSLIGPDFYDAGQTTLFDEDEMRRVNVFDWRDEVKGFGRIMARGGFDCVIGNPPYVRIQTMKEWAPTEVEFYKRQYVAASKGNYDIYLVFVEMGLNLIRKDGVLGYILPSKFFTTDYGASLRTLLTESKVVDQVVDFGHAQVFENATTYTCLLFLDKSCPQKIQYLKVMPENISIASDRVLKIPVDSLGTDIWIFLDEAGQALLNKINKVGKSLLSLPALMSRGTSTGADNVFCLVDTEGKLSTRDGEPVDIEHDILRRPLYATDFTRYYFGPQNKEKIIFPYIVTPTGYELIEEKSLREKYPMTYEYLRSRKKELESRKQYKHWYAYSAPRNLHIHDKADLLIPLLANHGLFAQTTKDKEKFCVMASAGFSVSLTNVDPKVNLLYVLGLLNSKLLFWNLQIISNKFRGGWITCTKQYFGTLPIRTIDFTNPAEKAQHDKLVSLVDNMLELQKKYHEARMEQDKELYERQIKVVDAQIDELVYDLYGLTEEEIKVVEKSL